MLRGTPLHFRTAPLCQAQNWRRWSGYLAASSYELLPDREYYAIRTAAALIDVSPLYKYLIRGPDAARLLNRVVTRDVLRMDAGQVLYTPWCDGAGKVIDDGLVAHLDEDLFRLTAADPTLRWLCDNALDMRVEVQDVSEQFAVLALQGPASRDVLTAVVDLLDEGSAQPPAGLGYFRLAAAYIDGVSVSISRTGYTGDLGYEIWIPADDAIRVWDTLLAGGNPFGLTPAGLLALDLARIEAGLILIDVDYVPTHKALIEAQKSSPYELNLGWAVDLDKSYFVGQSALADEKSRGSRWRLAGLEVRWEALERLYNAVDLPPQLPTVAWRTSVPVYARGRQVGYATSGCWSPILKKYIALAHLKASHATPGTEVTMEVTVEHRRRQAATRVVRLPFFDPPRKRA